MAHKAPSFLGSPHTTVSGARNQYDRDYQDDDNKILEIEDDNNSHPPSNQGDTPPRDQLGVPGTSQGVQSVRRPPGPPVPQDSVSPRAPEGIVTLKPTNPFACIQNPKKHKANTEVFHAFTGRPEGNDPSHIKLLEAGFAMAKRVFHPPKAER